MVDEHVIKHTQTDSTVADSLRGIKYYITVNSNEIYDLKILLYLLSDT